MHDDMQPDNMNQAPIGSHGESDREGAMAKADLHKLASYSIKLFKKLDDEAQLEGWVQAKITKAADYIASVYHYLEYEMEFSDYGARLDNTEMYNEDQKLAIKNKLMEAKSKIAELKKTQAEKMKSKDSTKVKESMHGGDQAACEACGGTGSVAMPERQVPEALKAKVDAYNKKAKAMSAAVKRVDANKNGIPDHLEDKEVDEDFGGDKEMKVGDTKKTRTGQLTKTDTGVTHKNTSYKDDGDEISANAKSGKGIKSHAKAQSAAEKKEKAPAQKMSPKSAKTWGMKDSEKFDNRDGAPAKPKKEKEVDETYGQGVYEGNEPKDKPKKGEKVGKEGNAYGNAVRNTPAGEEIKIHGKGTGDIKKESALKGKQKNLDVDGDGDIEADDLADLRAKKNKKVDEAAKEKCNHTEKGKKCPVHGLKECGMYEAAKQTMSRAAKGHEKYGKEGMAALAKAGKEGKDLDKIRDKYNKYDEGTDTVWKNKAKSIKESLDAMAGTTVEEDQAQAQAGLQALLDYAKQNDPQGLAQAVQQGGQAVENYFKDLATKIPATPGAPAAAPATAPTANTAAPAANAPANPGTPAPNQMSESIETTRMREQMARLNQNENIIVKESSEVDQLRALTKRLLG